MDLITQPVDILVEIFKYVPPKEIIRLRQVAKGINLIIKQLISRSEIILNLSETKITDAGLVHLQGAHTIDLSGMNVTDAGLVHLKGVLEIQTNLVGLDSRNRESRNRRFRLLQIHTIDLGGTNVTDAGLVHLK